MLLLTNAIAPDRMGGLERYVRELSGALARAGADVVLVARRVSAGDPVREQAAEGLSIVRYQTPSTGNPLYALGYPAAAAWAAAGAVRRAAGARVIHTHFPLQGVPAAILRVPFVHTFHAPFHRELLPEHHSRYLLPEILQGTAVAGLRWAEGQMLSRPRRVITLSRFMASQAEGLGARVERIELIPGGVDTGRFCPGEPIADDWARDGGPLLFSARRLVPRTGVTELVRAMAPIASKVPGVRLAIAGRGPLEASIRALIGELGLDRAVRLLGWVPEQELVGWNRAADLVVLPTQELEGFGLAAAEALACGTPVVGTPAGATPELLGLLDRRLVSRDATPEGLAEAVVGLVGDGRQLGELAARARGVVHPQLSLASVADRHLALYEELAPSS